MKCSQPCQEFCKWIETLPYHKKYALKKKDCPHLPICFKETFLGESVLGSKRQFRGPFGAHVHEFEDRWVLHRDKVNADENPLGHLVSDAPEYILSAIAGLATGLIARNKRDNKSALLAGWCTSTFMFLLGKIGKAIDEDDRETEAKAPRLS
ncbi:MAG: hypothetical protein ACXQT4_01330 [Methanotrichaceae archaeon]